MENEPILLISTLLFTMYNAQNKGSMLILNC